MELFPARGVLITPQIPNPTMNRTPKTHGRPGWDGATVLRYAVLQIPGILLCAMVLWIVHSVLGIISGKLAWLVLLLWIIKDSLLFFLVWPAYQAGEGDGWYSLVGLLGEVRRELHPEGYVRVGGVLWKAKADPGQCPIAPGTRVEVVGREGIKLLVRPLQS